jgi:hypothetical protein
MVLAVRRGLGVRVVARRFRKSPCVVRKWVARARGCRLDRVDWADRPPGNPRPRRTSPAQEAVILKLRRWLQLHSALGECGAQAIHRTLVARGSVAPCVRTIARVLARHGVIRVRRIRRRPPPPGWHLPAVAAAQAELDAFDFVEGLTFSRQRSFDVLTAVSLWGHLAGAQLILPRKHLRGTLRALLRRWRRWGLPTYAQFDNDSIFQGSHGQPSHLGRIAHLCLCLGVVPVFAPPREQGFQNQIESFNALWQAKVWHRRRHRDATQLRGRSEAYLQAYHAKHAARLDASPPRRIFPAALPRQPVAPGVIFIRRADARGHVTLGRRSFRLAADCAHRLFRAEWHLDSQQLSIFALHRSTPDQQPLVRRCHLKLSLTPWYSAPR